MSNLLPNEDKFLCRITREVEVTREEGALLMELNRKRQLNNEEIKLLGKILARCADKIVSLDFYDCGF